MPINGERERVREGERGGSSRGSLSLGSAALFILVCAPFLGPASAQDSGLPFSTDETTGPLTLSIRHSVEFDRKARKLTWEKLEVDLSRETRLRIAPGSLDLSTSATNRLSIEMDVHKGSIRAEPTLRGDYSWASPLEVRLEPRDLHWADPLIDVLGIELGGKFELDSALTESPAMLGGAEIEKFGLASVSAGPYRAANVAARGAWARPAWRLDSFSAETFSGKIAISGQGIWGTGEPIGVSLDVKAEGIDLAALLKAFEIPRADQVQARVSGAVRIDAVGREWRKLDFDLHGDKGTVFLDREMIHFILGQGFGGTITREQVEQVLTGTFGADRMIPFPEMALKGSMDGDRLRLDVPLINDALKITQQINVDDEILWDSYDQLIDTGLKNVGLLDVGAESVPKAEADN